MKAYVKAKKPLITQKHKKQHLEFAKKYKDQKVEDWRNVVFSDETKVIGLELMGKNGAGKNQVLLFNQIMSSLLLNMEEDQ